MLFLLPKKNYWHKVRLSGYKNNGIMIIENSIPDNNHDEKDWADPSNPEKPDDERDEEQFTRQVNEAKRRKNNLTEKDHIDKPKKTDH